MSGQADAPGGAARPEGAATAGTGDGMAPEPMVATAGPDAGMRHDHAGAAAPGDAAGRPGATGQATADATGAQAPPPRHADNGAPAGEGRDGVACAGADGTGDASPDQAAPDAEPADAVDPALLAEGARIAEALIFASDRPVTPAMLGAVLPPGVAPGAVVAALAEACEGRGVIIAEVAGGWAFRTAPDLASRLTKVVQAPRRLPRAAMEALSIIAYHQPCTRGEIEEIRGAALAQTTLEALLELGLVAPRGRREVPGRPTLWGTTPKFLEQFGLKALGDLPRKEELVTAETGPALPLGGPAQRPGTSERAADAQAPDEATDPCAGAAAPGEADDEPAENDTPAGAGP